MGCISATPFDAMSDVQSCTFDTQTSRLRVIAADINTITLGCKPPKVEAMSTTSSAVSGGSRPEMVKEASQENLCFCVMVGFSMCMTVMEAEELHLSGSLHMHDLGESQGISKTISTAQVCDVITTLLP